MCERPAPRLFAKGPHLLVGLAAGLALSSSVSASIAGPVELEVTPNGIAAGEPREVAASPKRGHAPVISGILPEAMNHNELEAQVGQALTLTLLVDDPDADPVTVRVASLPGGAQFDAESRMFTWTPTVVGAQAVRFVASDGMFEVSRTLLIQVRAADPQTVATQNGVEKQAEPEHEYEEVEWESYMLPGAGYAGYVPRAKEIGAFSGVLLQIDLATWIHQNDNRGPSHGRVYISSEILQGKSTQPILFIYAFGTSLSFERNARRSWLIPHYGLEFGGFTSDTLGNHFQATPYLGVHLFASPNLFTSLRVGYRMLPGQLEQLGGLQASGSLEFSVW
ncbi:MAG TPA: hypothetical protein VHM70_19805 [Polyangiaceae bacterium]|nr:hypothetical protein [Polyangiaceae bacterium]